MTPRRPIKRLVPYKEIKKCLTVIGEVDGQTEWLFEPGTLNEGRNFWDDDYLDPVVFNTKLPSHSHAARRIACANAITIKY